VEAIAREIHGYRVSSNGGDQGGNGNGDGEGRGHGDVQGELVAGFADLAADGSTACGCWIYSGLYSGGVNRPRQRAAKGAYAHGWGFAWPSDRRILYNRCSARPDGAPWRER
jgi:formate dehydrogenase major subunit